MTASGCYTLIAIGVALVFSRRPRIPLLVCRGRTRRHIPRGSQPRPGITTGSRARPSGSTPPEAAATLRARGDAETKGACATANVADESASQRFPGWNVHSCNDGYVFTAPVGAFAANGFSVNDMLGNVFEWVEDCWHDRYDGAPTNGSAWSRLGCNEREMRGGSWFTTPAFVRFAYRNRFEPGYRSSGLGFRVVRDLNQ